MLHLGFLPVRPPRRRRGYRCCPDRDDPAPNTSAPGCLGRARFGRRAAPPGHHRLAGATGANSETISAPTAAARCAGPVLGATTEVAGLDAALSQAPGGRLVVKHRIDAQYLHSFLPAWRPLASIYEVPTVMGAKRSANQARVLSRPSAAPTFGARPRPRGPAGYPGSVAAGRLLGRRCVDR